MTRQLMAPFVLAGAIVATACNQGTAPASPPAAPAPAPVAAPTEDVEATITQLERDWVAAIMKKDTAAINRLLADDLQRDQPNGACLPQVNGN